MGAGEKHKNKQTIKKKTQNLSKVLYSNMVLHIQ